MPGKSTGRQQLEAKLAEQRAQAEFRRRLEELKTQLAEADDETLRRTMAEKRVDFVLELMVGGLWVSGQTHRQLARDWSISPSRVMAIAAEAGRQLARYCREDKEARVLMRARIVTSLERIARKAESRGSYAGYRDALEAQTRLAQLFGFLKPDGAQVAESSPFADWTEAEKLHYAETGEMPERVTRANGHDRDARH